MKKSNKEKFEKMVCEALTKYYKDIHNYKVYEVLQKAQFYRENITFM